MKKTTSPSKSLLLSTERVIDLKPLDANSLKAVNGGACPSSAPHIK